MSIEDWADRRCLGWMCHLAPECQHWVRPAHIKPFMPAERGDSCHHYTPIKEHYGQGPDGEEND
jgi:hypothetical protein